MSSFSIDIEDHGSYECAEDDTFLRAALRAGVGIPYECSVGSCGTCKISILEGGFECLRPDAPGLSPRDLRKGRQLACQCKPISDCKINARPNESYLAAVRPGRFSAHLLAKRNISRDMIEFNFEADGPASFLPGQYALFEIPGIVSSRAYSMSNIENEESIWEFIIRRIPDGAATSYLFDGLTIGESLSMDGPYGNAYLRPPSGRKIVCIAGGSGIAPMLSVARGAALLGGNAAHTYLFCGGRKAADLPQEDVLSQLLAFDSELHFEMALSEDPLWEANGRTVSQGYIHQVADQRMTGGSSAHGWNGADIYLAGPPPMITSALDLLAVDRDVDLLRIRYDRFF